MAWFGLLSVQDAAELGASPLGERDPCRAAVGGMRFAGHEEAQFTALRYFALDGTDHASTKSRPA
jgi:hypothetical protein